MSEQCPAKNLDDRLFAPWFQISEAYIPDECLRCIERSSTNPSSKVDIKDTFNEGLSAAREFVDDDLTPVDAFDRWSDITLKYPDQSVIRLAVLESGFDLGLNYGLSYAEESRTELKTITFECSTEIAEDY